MTAPGAGGVYSSRPPHVYAVQNVGYMPPNTAVTEDREILITVPAHGCIWPVTPDGGVVDDDERQHEVALVFPVRLAAYLVAAVRRAAEQRGTWPALSSMIDQNMAELRRNYP